ncbi:MAG: EAL domain-containing protein [Burkholderiaceae bacterium]
MVIRHLPLVDTGALEASDRDDRAKAALPAAPAHPLLKRQLHDAGVRLDRVPEEQQGPMRRFIGEVELNYRAWEQSLLGAERAERFASDELAELNRHLRHERERLEYKVRDHSVRLAMSQAELAEAQRLAGMGSWQYLCGARRLEVSAELVALLDLPGGESPRRPGDLLAAIAEDDRLVARNALRACLRSPGTRGVELRVITHEGDIRWFGCRIESEAGPHGRIARLRGTFLDITDRRAAQERIERLAYHDELTGLPNRNRFRERLDAAMKRSSRTSRPFALLFVDLDGFKEINDSLGHDAGDLTLCTVAERLRADLRDEDLLSRFGGDEFLILVENMSSRADVTVVAEKVLASISEPIRLANIEARLSGSVGIAIYPDDAQDGGALLRNADAAMYAAKENGKPRYHFYIPEMSAQIMARLSMVQALRQAIEGSQFVTAYQPIVDGHSGSIEGAEALVRWSHPTRGIVSPGEFISIAEETGLVAAIGGHVLVKACQQVASWRASGNGGIYVSVNVSPSQLASGTFLDEVDEAIRVSGIEPSALQLEITESTVMRDAEGAASLLRRLKDRGVRLSLDDFGTGYSSLAYLRQFPIDVIKIDRCFVRDIERRDDEVPIVRAIIAIANGLGASVVAEGVETEAQRDALLSLGCRRMQGFLFHRPTPASVLDPLLRGRQAATGELVDRLGRRAARSRHSMASTVRH